VTPPAALHLHAPARKTQALAAPLVQRLAERHPQGLLVEDKGA
jgi:hypothetical protein